MAKENYLKRHAVGRERCEPLPPFILSKYTTASVEISMPDIRVRSKSRSTPAERFEHGLKSRAGQVQVAVRKTYSWKGPKLTR